jgi:hypothetical protein
VVFEYDEVEGGSVRAGVGEEMSVVKGDENGWMDVKKG